MMDPPPEKSGVARELPEKSQAPGSQELRFTRGRQGAFFFVVAVAALCVSAILWRLAIPPSEMNDALLSTPLWALIPVPIAAAAAWLGRFQVKHAYLILSPVGIEIFPTFFPSDRMDLMPWGEIESASVDGGALIVRKLGGGGAVISLAPIGRAQRFLLDRAVAGIAEKRGAASGASPMPKE
jgi:hypothetical protein